ncbi:MAG: TIM barrel protein [Candidatus Hydrogenedentes bacterium]|nr:TIM barrel protein [Candidatus Hydrogenedentota bacterium]
MKHKHSRREFIKVAGSGVAALSLAATVGEKAFAAREYKISLAGWSFHRAIQKGEMPMLDMPKVSRQEFDIEGIELVNQLLEPVKKPFAEMKPYLDTLAKNAVDNNVKILLIMVDGEGNIGGRDEDQRKEAVERHKKWLDICEYLGCHSMRMNWAGAQAGTENDEKLLDEFIKRSTPGFHELCEYGDKKGQFVIIENHGGPSSYPHAVEKLMAAVNHPRFGTLPDFGNFPQGADIYSGTDTLMKYAHKAVSAKCHDFDDTTGEETKMDYAKLIEIVVDKHGYNGFIGIEYEGDRLSESEGVKRCKALLDKLKA